MPLRQTRKVSEAALILRDAVGQNPLAASPQDGFIENVYIENNKLARAAFAPLFQARAVADKVWRLYEFRFVRDGSPEQQWLTFKSNGKVYRRSAGSELEVFPGKTSFSALTRKPAVWSIADRLHVSDGTQYLIYDGWDWFKGGLVAPASAPTSALVAGSLTGSYRLAATAVHIRNAVRVHESSRSPISVAVAPSAQNIRVDKPSGLPARATHWSVYISELSTSDILRRAATFTINQATGDISAEPAGTNPQAPIRNDPVQPTRLLAGWKNRLAMRDEAQKDNFWFTAFQEVKARLNGAPEESLPGRTASSISDLVNSWTLPDRGEETTAAVWHENFLFLFSDRNGYLVRGEGGLLDSRGLRDFFPVHQFSFGAAGPFAAISTPRGLFVFSKDRHLWLWEGSQAVQDVGFFIQDDLDAIAADDLPDVELVHYAGNGRDWLLLTGVPNQDVKIFDMGNAVQGEGEEEVRGVWLHNAQVNATSAAVFRDEGNTYLVIGDTNGDVRVLDTVSQPTHLNLSAILGKTYLGSAVQNSPACKLRTSSFNPEGDVWTEAQYLTLVHRTAEDTEATGNRSTAPTVTAFYNQTDPENPSGGVALTLGSRLAGTDEQRAWLKPSATASSAGAFAKRFQVEVSWPAGKDVATDGSGRQTLLNNEILQLGLAWQPRAELAQ